MGDKLIVSLIQADLHWEDKNANLQVFEECIDGIKNTDLIVLPEMFPTGFTMNPTDYFEEMGGNIVQWMIRIAAQKDAAVCGSLIIKEAENFFNRFLCVTSEGVIAQYNKRHLFRMGEENEHYTRGQDRVVFEYKGWRIMPQICYDLRFPVWYRNKNDYDLMINVANWPAVRSGVWSTLLRARAVENQCYVIAVNRIGPDAKGLDHCGDTMLVDFKGDIEETLEDKPGVINRSISLNELNEFKSKFPAFLDADDFDLSP